MFFIVTLLLLCAFATLPLVAWSRSPDLPSLINSYSYEDKDYTEYSNIPIVYISTLDYANETIVQDHDLVVDNGMLVRMENVTLVVNSARDGAVKIEVRDGGSLLLNNSSVISNGSAYNFFVYPTGTFHMRDSTLQGCGYAGQDIRLYGLWISSGNNAIENSTFENNYYGVVFDHSNNNFIANSSIRQNVVGIYINGSVSNMITGNEITNNTEGARIESSRVNVISDNLIAYNTAVGLSIGPSSDLNFLTNNTIYGNAHGLVLDSSISNTLVKNRMTKNTGPAVELESAHINFFGNNTLDYNGYGMYMNDSGENMLSDNEVSFNHEDGICLLGSSNNYIANNNASYNGGYGFNVSDSSKRTFISRSNNVALGNGKGDFEVPEGALTVLEISVISILFAFADKTLYLIDFQKVIITNIFSGIVSPIRDPLLGGLEKAINRMYALLGFKRWNYKNAHISQRFGFLFMHFIDGDEIRSVVYVKSYRGLLSSELVLTQIRFMDVLLRDRVVLRRNAAYFLLMTAIGLAVYYMQVLSGTYKWPYLLPIVVQFSIMFIIGLIIQSSIVGRSQRIKYEIQPGEDTDGLRRELREARDRLEEHHQDGKTNDRKYDDEMDRLKWALETVDYLDVHKEYLLFTKKGYESAIAGYGKLLETDPDNAFSLAGLSEAYAMLGKWKEDNGESATQHYERALAEAEKSGNIDDTIFESHRAMAIALHCCGRLEEADSEAKKALEVNGRDAESYHALAMLKLDQQVRAKLLAKSIALDPDLTISRRDLGIVLIEQGKIEKAFAQFTYTLKRNEADPVAHRYMGYLYARSGRPDKALTEYRRAIELDPGYRAARIGLEEIAMKPGIISEMRSEGDKVE
jgi:parallel beta-helix repeat protein